MSHEGETLCRHALSVAASGSIIYSTDDADVAFERLPYLDQRLRGDLGSALGRLSDAGISVRAVQLRLLCPFPTDVLGPLLDRSSPSVMIENNYSGQLNALFRQRLGRGCDHLVLKYSGRPVSGEALFPALRAIHAGGADARIVLRNGFE